MKIERRLIINPAWDKRNPDPKKDYGIHGVEMRWCVIGKKGAVQFVLYTNWQLPEITQKHLNDPLLYRDKIAVSALWTPMPADIGYHSYKPHYEGQTPISDCDILKTPCYYDGSTLQAEKYYEILLREGGEALWKSLEKYYKENL